MKTFAFSEASEGVFDSGGGMWALRRIAPLTIALVFFFPIECFAPESPTCGGDIEAGSPTHDRSWGRMKNGGSK